MFAMRSSAAEPWPERYKHVKVVFDVVGRETLPKSVFDLLLANDPGAQIPDRPRIAHLDLTSDGQNELILEYRQSPGTDPSPQFAIFQKKEQKFSFLGHFPGEFHVCRSGNNYCQLETWQELFPGHWNRYLFRFQHGRFRSVRDEAHDKRF